MVNHRFVQSPFPLFISYFSDEFELFSIAFAFYCNGLCYSFGFFSIAHPIADDVKEKKYHFSIDFIYLCRVYLIFYDCKCFLLFPNVMFWIIILLDFCFEVLQKWFYHFYSASILSYCKKLFVWDFFAQMFGYIARFCTST